MKSRCTAFLGSWGVVEALELGQLVRIGNSTSHRWTKPRRAAKPSPSPTALRVTSPSSPTARQPWPMTPKRMKRSGIGRMAQPLVLMPANFQLTLCHRALKDPTGAAGRLALHSLLRHFVKKGRCDC